MARGSRRASVQADVDDDAEDRDVPLKPDASDVERLVWLLDIARRRGYRLGPNVQVGAVIVNVLDLRLAKREAMASGAESVAPAQSIWQEHGHDPDDDEPLDGTGGH